MKKLFTISFMFIYLFLVVGVNVAVHFCGETVNSVEFALSDSSKEPDSCCPTQCGDECCKTEIKTTKIEDLHKSENEFKINSFEIAIPVESESTPVLAVNQTKLQHYTTDHSPPVRDIRIYNSSFII